MGLEVWEGRRVRSTVGESWDLPSQERAGVGSLRSILRRDDGQSSTVRAQAHLDVGGFWLGVVSRLVFLVLPQMAALSANTRAF